MEKFKIYGFTNLEGRGVTIIDPGSLSSSYKTVVITDSEKLNIFSTYNENYNIEENEKINMTFEIIEKPNGEKNPFIDLIFPQSVLGINFPNLPSEAEDSELFPGTFHLLKIVGITPSYKENNIIYKVDCEDYASQVLSRQAVGLSLDFTGTLQETAEEILGLSRKNNKYKNLNKDIALVSYAEVDSKTKNGFIYQDSYINFKGTSLSLFKNEPTQSYAEFIVTDRYVINELYQFTFNIIGFNGMDVGVPVINNMYSMYQLVGLDKYGQETFVSDIQSIQGKDISIPAVLYFQYKPSEKIVLRIIEDSANVWKNYDEYSISLNGFKITKDKRVAQSYEEAYLRLVKLENFREQFSDEFGNYETRMTFSIENSNIYNALYNLALLYNAEVKFDYLRKGVYFVSKDYRTYKGYRLSPEINLSSLSRPQKSNEMATVLHVRGGGDIDTAMPALPKEWRQFLTEASKYNFTGGKWFHDYTTSSNYITHIEEVSKYIIESDSREERLNEIRKFAEQMQKIPTFESTIYNFEYFERKNAITHQSELNDLIYNSLRKINIMLNIKTFEYYTIYSQQATQLMQIAFYIGAINTEKKFQYNTFSKLNADNAPAKYTATWVSYMNQIDASLAAETNYRREIESVLGFKDGVIDLTPGSFPYNTLTLFGYKNKEENGIADLVKINSEARQKKLEELIDIQKKIDELEAQIEDESVSSMIKDSLQVDLAGKIRDRDNVHRYLGNQSVAPDSDYYMPGIYVLEGQYYSELLKHIESLDEIPESIRLQGGSLYDFVINKESEINLVNKKESILETLSNQFEPFYLEGIYENGDEITPEGLLDQALKAFVEISDVKVSYSIGAINVTALLGVDSHPNVGDRVRLDGRFQRLEDGTTEDEELIITGYTENLRDISTLNLNVVDGRSKDSMVSKLLKQTNFVRIGDRPSKSNLEIDIPADLATKKELPDLIKEVASSDISVASMYDGMIK